MGVVRIHRLSLGVGVLLGSVGCDLEDDLDVRTVPADPVTVVMFVELIQHIHERVGTSLRHGPFIAGTVEFHRCSERPVHRFRARLIQRERSDR